MYVGEWLKFLTIFLHFRQENPNKYIAGLSKWVKSKVTHFTSCVSFLRELGEFQTARESEEKVRRKEEEEKKKESKEESGKSGVGGGEDAKSEAKKTESKKNARKTSDDPDAPLYSIFTTVTPKRAPPMPTTPREPSATSSYFPTPASGVFPARMSAASSRGTDEDDAEMTNIRDEFERMKAEVEAERTEVEKERRKNDGGGGAKKFDWRAKRDEAIRRRREREDEQLKRENKFEETSAASSASFVAVKQEETNDPDADDVQITKVTKAKSWQTCGEEEQEERDRRGRAAKKSASSSAVVVEKAAIDESASNANYNRKRLLFAPSPNPEVVKEEAADRLPVVESEMDLFNDGTDDDEDMFSATRRLEENSAEKDSAAKIAINDDGGEIRNRVSPSETNGKENLHLEEDQRGVRGGVKKRCLSSSSSKEGESGSSASKDAKPAKLMKKETLFDDDDDDFEDRSAKKSQKARRSSLKRFKKTADKSWTSEDSRAKDSKGDAERGEESVHPFSVRGKESATSTKSAAATRVALSTPLPDCPSVIECASCGGTLYSSSSSSTIEKKAVGDNDDVEEPFAFRALPFRLPRADDENLSSWSSSKPLVCPHQDRVIDAASAICLRTTMDPRKMEDMLVPLSSRTDDATGLPTVLWAEELGCGLRAFACAKCPTTARRKRHDTPVALEIMNDSNADVSPPLRKGEILFPRRFVKLCPKRIDG